MKTKLLFIITSYIHGGTNRSLQFLLSVLNPEQFDIYLLCIVDGGAYQKVFKDYKVIKMPSYLYYFWNSHNILMKGLRFFNRKCNYIIFKILSSKYIKKLESTYRFDKIIAYEEGIATYVTSHFNIEKIAWVHCDYQYYNKKNTFLEKQSYNKIDKIICVSKHTSQSFAQNYPKFKHKIDYAYNLLNIENIKLNSNENIKNELFNNKLFTIISIGRFDPIKQFERIPEIVSKIKKQNEGSPFKWYIIGGGNENVKSKIISEIEKYNLNDTIQLLGVIDNPYPYIKNSNLLVSTSYSEACPYVINEAKALKIPVVSTDYASAFELISSDNGIITSIEKMPSVLFNLINNINDQYSQMLIKLQKHQFDSSKDYHKIVNILNR